MHLTGLLDRLTATPSFEAVVQQIGHADNLPAQGIIRSARPFVIAALAQQLECPVLVITAQVNRAYDITEQLPAWLPETEVLRFQEPTGLFYDRTPWTGEVIRARLQTLATLTTPLVGQDTPQAVQNPTIIVTSALALMQKTLPVREFRRGMRRYRSGQQITQERILNAWIENGYESVSVVVTPGTFSRRGGILDVFPIADEQPVRIEFFGDEIESLRRFNPETQRSTGSIDSFTISPAREALPVHMPPLAERLQPWFNRQPDIEDDPASSLVDQAPMIGGTVFPYGEFYLPCLYPAAGSLLDYLPEEILIVVDDWQMLRDVIGELENQALNARHDYTESDSLPPDYPLAYHTWDDLQDYLHTHAPLQLGQSAIPDNETVESSHVLGDMFIPGPRFGGQLRLFLENLQEQQRTTTQSIVVTRQAQRIAELWNEQHTKPIHPVSQLDSDSPLADLTFVEGGLTEGWVLRQSDSTDELHLLTDAEIFGWKRPEPRRRVKPRAEAPESFFADLSEGDYVVHIDYGIGIFRGIHNRTLDDSEREYLLVEYAGGDKLYVPIHQADRLSRYIGGDQVSPTLNKLGTQDWQRTRQRTRKAIQDIADELLELYAARQVVEGYAFSPDTPWQHELEAAFPYVETQDQLRALQAVKVDMEAPRPMDRLICGDVGYGKTEVALRAAFKAVMDGKQVAILVPTTVLAQQHYNSFLQRLMAFPVNVAMLSRFRTVKEQQKILRELAEGKVDIIIGTHRLLQDDVRFKDMGLLVIDEEQRFGVTHKEYLKQKRTRVDVLTMTATPIPRTLYMGLTGVRDISLIQTAPQERLPVVTHVGTYDEKVVRQAILRELDREGQVFFVHNRVQTIDTITARLKKLVPEARFIIGHGQMPDGKLESVMTAFAEGSYDVLVSTTIIESGLDIPNANTLIIDRADWFGLAQLYQIRGRVGRSARQAFAYFFHPNTAKLTLEALARLETIGEYTELGSGMSIAVRDLEIRGMGDMLGVRQSGHIEAVGFHLYTQMLSDAVKQVRARENLPEIETPQVEGIETDEVPDQAFSTLTIDLPVSAYLPTDFIPEMSLRIQLYRRLASIETEEALQNLEAELQDRFGSLPEAVQGLLYQLQVKLAARNAGVTAIASDGGKMHIKLPYLGQINRMALQEYLGEDVRVSRTAIWLQPDIPNWQARLLEILHHLNRETIIETLMPDV